MVARALSGLKSGPISKATATAGPSTSARTDVRAVAQDDGDKVSLRHGFTACGKSSLLQLCDSPWRVVCDGGALPEVVFHLCGRFLRGTETRLPDQAVA
jgi:hypothetical protein